MKPLRKIASELLGFDRRERRATYTLAVIFGLLLLIRILVPVKRAAEDIIIIPHDEIISRPLSNGVKETVLFRFDPNTAPAETLVKLGFSARQAATLINYRNAGARFRKPSDIYRVYGIDTVFAERLIPWIDINLTAPEGIGEARSPAAGSSYNNKRNLSRDEKLRNPATGKIQPEAWKKRAEGGLDSSVKSVAVIDLNSCSAGDLEQLPGVGAVLSARIVKYRDLLGGYVSASQLTEVYGLDSSAVEMIAGRLKVTGDGIRIIHLDTCSWGQMARHPYLGPEAARAIVRYRTLMGVSITVDDMVRQRVISREQAARIAPYVTMPEKASDNAGKEER